MDLQEYPKTIADLETKLYRFTTEVEKTRKILSQIEVEIDTQVAFDTSLKNDAQRKAKRKQLIDEHPTHWEHSEFLEQTLEQRETLNIELTQFRNEFSVLKLLKREEIARLELQRELI